MLSVLALPDLTVRSFLIQLSIIVSLWVSLYALNGWMFERLAFSAHVSWIFLPAALRMIAILLAGWVGTLGIFLGSLLTCVYFAGITQPVSILAISGVSALAPTFALLVCAKFWGNRINLAGLSPLNLLTLGVVAAASTAVMHNIYFAISGQVESVARSVGAMFVGDLVGTLAVLYAAKWLLHLLLAKRTTGSA